MLTRRGRLGRTMSLRLSSELARQLTLVRETDRNCPSLSESCYRRAAFLANFDIVMMSTLTLPLLENAFTEGRINLPFHNLPSNMKDGK